MFKPGETPESAEPSSYKREFLENAHNFEAQWRQHSAQEFEQRLIRWFLVIQPRGNRCPDRIPQRRWRVGRACPQDRLGKVHKGERIVPARRRRKKKPKDLSATPYDPAGLSRVVLRLPLGLPV